jgi:hypothetical protein
MGRLEGIVVSGYGVASGRGKDPRFTNGTIKMQQPFFLARGVDLSPYYPGTLNVDVAPLAPEPNGSVFDGFIRWHPDFNERFLLSPVEVDVKGRCYAGLWYYPHPETKTDHFQSSSVLELLLPWIDGLAVGDKIAVRL